MNDINKQANLHSAGAIVNHKSSFADLATFKNNFELSKQIIDIWVAPFYMFLTNNDISLIKSVGDVKSEITKELVTSLLGDFNWRTRQTGAFFAAIKNYADLIDTIGVHLLKSEVCFAGQVYAYVLASFNTSECVEYLNLYLDYYLTKPDLWFDQRQVLEAVTYLDKVNGTNNFEQHIKNWMKFIKNKPHWNKEINTEWIENQLRIIEDIKHYV